MENVAHYVTHHIDEAIEKGWIQLYFQPIIRSLSHTTCAFEALARWQDPVRGLLTPGDFIPALEESRQIHKLDLYIFKLLCQNYHPRADQGLPMVPVSFNLSRLDFIICDIFTEIEKLTQAYQLPPSQLRIEITESVFIKDIETVNQTLNKFRAAGYQIWMDDFGSGYSSLNVLKDYEFDTIKLDMAFLSNFTDRSKEIVKSVVDMAKHLGIHILTEGVETLEQYTFLRNIGCEMLQGFLFSKPLPYIQAIEYIEELGLTHETPEMRRYYSAAGSLDFLTDRPMALVEYEAISHHVRFLFANQPYRQSLASKGIYSLEQCEYNLNTQDSPIIHIISDFIKKVIASDEQESMTYIKGGMFMWLRIKKIAQQGPYYLGCCTLQNITTTTDELEQVKLTGLKEKIYDLYDTVTMLDIKTRQAQSLTFWRRDPDFLPGHEYGFEQAQHHYTEKYIAPEDRDRFYHFSNYATLENRCQAAPQHTLTDYFRTLTETGSYQWHAHYLILLPESQGHHYLHIASSCRGADAKRVQRLIQVYKEYFEKK